ncbi:Ionotropic receptor 122 [Diabrotica virgifera virgifera]|nr:Ionotropic receptor 122 [Diabrotica virgifera virgifera]
MLILIIQLFLISSAKTILPIDPVTDISTEKSLNICAAELSRIYFKDQFDDSVTVIFENTTKFLTLRSFLVHKLANENKACYIISLKKAVLSFKSTTLFKHILIEISSVDKFKETIEMVKVLPSWNPKANFLVVSFTKFGNAKVVANILFTLLWKEDIAPIAVLLIDQNNLTDFNIFTRSSIYGTNIDVSVSNTYKGLVRESTTYSKTVFSINKFKKVRAKFYPWRPFVIYNGISFNLKNPGIEVKLIKTLAQIFNLTVEFYGIDTCASGEVFDNGTVTMEFQELANNKFDIIFGGYTLTYGRMLYFNPSVPYYLDELLWCVPSRIYYEFNITIHKEVIFIVLLILLVLISCIWYVDQSTEPKLRFDTSIDGIVLKTFAICLHVTIARLPKTGTLRYFIGLLIIFAFLCNTMVTMNITSLFIGRKPSQKYDSMSKIYYKSNLKTYFVTNSFRYFTSDFIEGIPRDVISKRKIDCHDNLECLKIVADGDSALLTRKSNTEYLLKKKYVDKKSLYCFHYSYGSSISLIMKKSFMYINEFNRIIHLLLSTGVVQKWEKEIFSLSNEDNSELNVQGLKLQEIIVIFYILIFGCTCSILVFLFEIYTM